MSTARQSSATASDIAGPASDEVSRIRFLGVLMALAGALAVIFSTLKWLTIENLDNTAWLSISGMGGLSSSGMRRDASQLGLAQDVVENHTAMPGIWTLIFGALLLVSAIPLILRRNQAVAALAGLAFSLASTIACFVFIASPGNGVLDSEYDDKLQAVAGVTASISMGYGLATVLIVSIAGIAFSGLALGLSLARRGY